MSLPYMLKDSDPSDPEKGWTKTWAYLEQLGKYVSSYPASSTIMNNQFASGQFELVPGIVSMDVINHHTGVFPATDKPTLFTDQNWVTDAHYIMVPKGVAPEALYVMLQLITFTLRPESQAMTFENGSVTPAITGVDVSKASPAGQQVYAQFARPDYYPQAFKTGKTHTPLTPVDQVKAFDLWQRKVGSRVGS
jgi:putative spermidine/putrescine transport system substrate-binding protein